MAWHRAVVKNEARWERLLSLAAGYRARREHIEACMSCTSGMGIAAARSSTNDCMSCPTLAKIAADVARHSDRSREV